MQWWPRWGSVAVAKTPTRDPRRPLVHSAIQSAIAPVGKVAPFLFDVGSLADRLRALPDRRQRRGVRYSWEILLVLMILAKLGGADYPSASAGWLQARTTALRVAF